KNLWVNALSIVSDAQAKLSWVIPDFYFNPRRLCVQECVAQCLACNPVDIVPDKGSEFAGRAVHLNTKLGSFSVAMLGNQAFAKNDQCASKIVPNQRRGAHTLDRISTLGDRLPGLLDGRLQRLPDFGAIEKHVSQSVELQQRALKTL